MIRISRDDYQRVGITALSVKLATAAVKAKDRMTYRDPVVQRRRLGARKGGKGVDRERCSRNFLEVVCLS
jgi:hypothetical protein